MKPRVGLFGIMQELYDEMIPGITETQAAYAASVAASLGDVAEIVPYQPGPATLASLVSLGGEKFRMVVAEGSNLDSPVLPALEMPYGQFRPTSGMRDCMNAWLAAGGTHHMVMNLGLHADKWKIFCRLNNIEYAEV